MAKKKISQLQSVQGQLSTSDKIIVNVVEDGEEITKTATLSQLPSYVDDIIEGYLYEGAFYEDAEHTIEITPEEGKIYVDMESNYTYRWSGSMYVQVGGEEQVQSDWNQHNDEAVDYIKNKPFDIEEQTILSTDIQLTYNEQMQNFTSYGNASSFINIADIPINIGDVIVAEYDDVILENTLIDCMGYPGTEGAVALFTGDFPDAPFIIFISQMPGLGSLVIVDNNLPAEPEATITVSLSLKKLSKLSSKKIDKDYSLYDYENTLGVNVGPGIGVDKGFGIGLSIGEGLKFNSDTKIASLLAQLPDFEYSTEMSEILGETAYVSAYEGDLPYLGMAIAGRHFSFDYNNKNIKSDKLHNYTLSIFDYYYCTPNWITIESQEPLSKTAPYVEGRIGDGIIALVLVDHDLVAEEGSTLSVNNLQLLSDNGVNYTEIVPDLKTINNESLIGSGNIVINTYAPFPDCTVDTYNYCSNGTIHAETVAKLIDVIQAFDNKAQGKAYYGEIINSNGGNCLPPELGNVEATISFNTGDPSYIAVVTLFSSNAYPYHWELNTASGIWRPLYTLPNTKPNDFNSKTYDVKFVNGQVQYVEDTGVDTSMSTTSTNPVQNKAVTQYLAPVLGTPADPSAVTYNFLFDKPTISYDPDTEMVLEYFDVSGTTPTFRQAHLVFGSATHKTLFESGLTGVIRGAPGYSTYGGRGAGFTVNNTTEDISITGTLHSYNLSGTDSTSSISKTCRMYSSGLVVVELTGAVDYIQPLTPSLPYTTQSVYAYFSMSGWKAFTPYANTGNYTFTFNGAAPATPWESLQNRVTALENAPAPVPPIATSSSVGTVKPDNVSISVDANGVITANYLDTENRFNTIFGDVEPPESPQYPPVKTNYILPSSNIPFSSGYDTIISIFTVTSSGYPYYYEMMFDMPSAKEQFLGIGWVRDGISPVFKNLESGEPRLDVVVKKYDGTNGNLISTSNKSMGFDWYYSAMYDSGIRDTQYGVVINAPYLTEEVGCYLDGYSGTAVELYHTWIATINAGDTSTTPWASLNNRVTALESIHEYSTTEKVVGTWTDGKDVYEITVTGEQLPASNTKIQLPSTTDRTIDVYGSIVKTDGYNQMLPNASCGFFVKEDDLRVVYTDAAISGRPYAITLRYTKADPTP